MEVSLSEQGVVLEVFDILITNQDKCYDPLVMSFCTQLRAQQGIPSLSDTEGIWLLYYQDATFNSLQS